MNQDVTHFIEELKESWHKEFTDSLRNVVHQAIPDVQERIQYKKPHFLKNGKYTAAISTSKEAVSFTIFNCSELEFPEGMFDGPPERKTLKLRKGDTVDPEQLVSLVREASSTL